MEGWGREAAALQKVVCIVEVRCLMRWAIFNIETTTPMGNNRTPIEQRLPLQGKKVRNIGKKAHKIGGEYRSSQRALI